MKVLLIDNYDSFTHNLKQMLFELDVETTVVRNDKVEMTELNNYDAIVLSPGPGTPDTAGDLKEIISRSYQQKPILGICLGMQAIGEVLDAKLKLMDEPLHGLATSVEHFNVPFFEGIPEKFTVGRYHSWVIDSNTVGDRIEVISQDEDGEIMGIKAKGYPVYGLQFHPESIMTEHGETLISNFLNQIN